MLGSFKLTVLVWPCSLLWQNHAGAHSEHGSVFLMSRDGSSIVRISAEGMAWGTSTPRWSPDGRGILYVARNGNENEFHVISAAGEKLTRVPVPSNITSVAGVSWFPDSTAITFGGRTEEPEESYDIYVMKLGTGEPLIRRIVENGIQPAWSPDGRLLAFTTFRDGNLEVYLVDGDGRNLRNLSRHEGYDGCPAWFPEGDRIAFESDRFGNLEICIADVLSGEVVNLTNHPGVDRQPAWSRDDREIVFVSNRDWNFHVYRMAADGSGVTRLTTGYVEDREPAWSPDGESICFVSNRGEPFLDGLRRWFGNWLTDWPDD